ncbi:Hemerythrin domain-containing protein [Fusarium acuminatum]|uniref:Hemerythrin domain-containing protein n=1 Tax=Fusarium acuminatum TaxID=5515 RepID=A0ABZ2WNA9_9HYPO
MSKPWVDGPFTLISSSKSGDSLKNPANGARKLAAEMTLVHNALLRGINAVYLQCDNIATQGTIQDKQDFANFAYSWSEMLHEHHNLEETDIFPEINKLTEVPNLMNANVDEHSQFDVGLKIYFNYLDKVKKEEEVLDGTKLRSIIDAFLPTLRTHLVNEIDTLLALEKYEDKVDWEEWFQKKISQVANNAMKDARYRREIFPLAIIFHDKTFEGGVWQNFPSVPWVSLLVLQWLFMNTHKSWWRFAGCNFQSKPQELPFA